MMAVYLVLVVASNYPSTVMCYDFVCVISAADCGVVFVVTPTLAMQRVVAKMPRVYKLVSASAATLGPESVPPAFFDPPPPPG